jgi:hypothetical protein
MLEAARMQRVTTQSITISAAVGNAVCASQTPAGAGYLTIDGANASGGVYTAPTNPRRLSITTGANESTKTFTITGTDRNGNPMVYTTAGASSATTTVYTVDFQTITSVYVSAATTGAITIGFAAQGATGWIPLDRHSSPVIGIGIELSTSANLTFTMQSTYDDVQAVGFQEWDAYPIASAVVTGTASAAHTITHVARAIRFVVSPWVGGTATFTVIEKAP